MIFKTVGELRAALADEPDDMPLISETGNPSMYRNFAEAGKLEVQLIGEGIDAALVDTKDPIFKKMKKIHREEPYTAILFR